MDIIRNYGGLCGNIVWNFCVVGREKGAWKMIGLCYKDMICGKLRWTVLCVVVVCMLSIVVGYLVGMRNIFINS